MKHRLTIQIANKVATCTSNIPIVCGNSDYEIEFIFDAEWEKHDVKTALFVVDGKAVPQVFSGTVCPVPVIRNTLIASVGVFAGTVDDGSLRTSTPALVECEFSVTDIAKEDMTPSDTMYELVKGYVEELTEDCIREGEEEYSLEIGENVKANAPGCASIGYDSEAGNSEDKEHSQFALTWGTLCRALRKRTVCLGWNLLCDENAENSLAGGGGVTILAKNAFGWGNGGILHPTATNSWVGGSLCEVYWADSLAGGYKCISKTPYSILWGEYLNSFGSNRAIFGKFNSADTTSIFIIGNGTDENHRSNAFWVKENGVVGAKTQFTAPELNVAKIITGGTLSINAFGGIVDFNNNKLQKIASPTANADATNKGYVDNQITSAINIANKYTSSQVTSTLNSAKNYTDSVVGDIDKALDSIIALQNSYIGGETV